MTARLLTLVTTLFGLAACSGTSIPVEPVTGFQQTDYLGTWYEIARLDHSFERGLSNVTATNSVREDGKIKVLNKGYNDKKSEFETATGKAYFPKGQNTGQLKVSFFGPFYGDYIIFGPNPMTYETAYISGGKDNYLWLLSRAPTVSDDVKRDFLQRATELGYDVSGLIWVPQNLSAESQTSRP